MAIAQAQGGSLHLGIAEKRGGEEVHGRLGVPGRASGTLSRGHERERLVAVSLVRDSQRLSCIQHLARTQAGSAEALTGWDMEGSGRWKEPQPGIRHLVPSFMVTVSLPSLWLSRQHQLCQAGGCSDPSGHGVLEPWVGAATGHWLQD